MLDCSFTSLRRAVKSTYAAKKIIKKKSHHMGVNAAAATKVCRGKKTMPAATHYTLEQHT